MGGKGWEGKDKAWERKDSKAWKGKSWEDSSHSLFKKVSHGHGQSKGKTVGEERKVCKRVVYGGGSTSQSSNHAVRVDNWLYVSGTIGVRPGSDTPEEGVIKQTTQILLNLGRVLKVGHKSDGMV